MIDVSEAQAGVAKTLKKQVPDRYLSSLFVDAAKRPAVQAIYAFDHEIRSVPDRVSEPLLGEIRLQWWREAIEEIFADKEPRAHEIVIALRQAIRDFGLSREHFDSMIEARAFDLYDESMKDWAAFSNYARATEATVLALAAQVLAPDGEVSVEIFESFGETLALFEAIRLSTLGITHRQTSLPHETTKEESFDKLRNALDRAKNQQSKLPQQVFPAVLHMSLIDDYARRLEAFEENPEKLLPSALRKRLTLLKHSLLGRI